MQLVITEPNGSSNTVELETTPISVGRAADNQLSYPKDPALSRYHLTVEPSEQGWSVRDCGSRNGTLVNSAALTGSHRLQVGDRIRAGQLIIDVHETPSKADTTVVTFIPPESVAGRRQSTIVTNLNQVLQHKRKSNRDLPLSARRSTEALIRAGRELAGHRPLEELFEVILELALSAVEAKRGVILTSENGELAARASRGGHFSISTSVRDRVIRDKAALLISDAQFDSALRSQHSIIMQQVRSVMAVPLQTGEKVIGVIYVDNGTTLRPFSEDDLELLTVMANVAGVRIEHSRLALIEQQEKLTQSEIAQARELQQSLLPGEPPPVEGYEISGYNLPCRAVGGDYYDFLTYSDGRLGLFIADVCGKGLAAALLMSSLEARVQMLCETEPDPATALKVLNRNIARRAPLGSFITAFYGLLEPASGTLQYASAGHNYPILVRANGQVELLKGGNLVMGLFSTVEYEARTVTLRSGDLLVLYSDGVTEAPSPEGKQLSESGFITFLLTNKSRSIGELLSDLVGRLRGWTGSPNFADDFTLVLLRRN